MAWSQQTIDTIALLTANLAAVYDLTVRQKDICIANKENILASSLDILLTKIDEVQDELAHISNQVLSAIEGSDASKAKVLQFCAYVEKLHVYVQSLSKRSLLTTTSSLNDKIKIWNLELSMNFQETITSICLIQNPPPSNEGTLTTKKGTQVIPPPPAVSTSEPLLAPLTRNNLAALSSGPIDTADAEQPEAELLLHEIKESADELRQCLDIYIAKISVKGTDFPEKSRLYYIYHGMSHLMDKIDAAMKEIGDNEVKIVAALTSTQSVFTNASNFNQTMQEFTEFFADFDKKTYYSFKSQVKKKLQLINLIFSSRCNHFMTSVCLNANMQQGSVASPVAPAGPPTSSVHYQQGVKYLFGMETPKNLNLAYAHFLEGAEGGDVLCMEYVAQCYHVGLGVDADIDAAQKWLQRAIQQGSASAKCSMALLLVGELQGSDIDEEDREVLVQHAITLLFNAASEGHIDAMTNLGAVFEKASEYDEAEKWYSKAAAAGCCRALNLLGLLQFSGRGSYSRKRLGNGDGVGEKKLAFLTFCASAKGGCANAYYNVGNCLEYGIGTDMDVMKALASYRAGADLGCPMAMYSLGYLLVKQELLKISDADSNSVEYASRNTVLHRNVVLDEGIKYLRMAYEQGVVDAAYQLGRVYELGPQAYDYRNALQPYLWAAERGHPKSAYCAANILYMYGDGTAKERTKGESTMYRFRAFELYKQAAEAGILDAMNCLGLLLEGDEEFTDSKVADYQLACKWYYQSGRAGIEEAILNLALLLASGRVSSFTTFDGPRMSLTDCFQWLVKDCQLTKEHLLTKFGFALRRIETLAHEDYSATIASIKVQNANRKYSAVQKSSEGSIIDSYAGRPPRPNFAQMLADISPIRSGLKEPPQLLRKLREGDAANDDGMGNINPDSPVRNSTLDLGVRQSLAASPYSGLKPLSKQYEALATAGTYDEFIDILASDSISSGKLPASPFVHDRAINLAKSQSFAISRLTV